MFFKNKIPSLLTQLSDKFQSLQNNIIAKKTQLKEISQTISHLEASVQKHDMAIEDLLDTWEEK